jgi:hypothetical protein
MKPVTFSQYQGSVFASSESAFQAAGRSPPPPLATNFTRESGSSSLCRRLLSCPPLTQSYGSKTGAIRLSLLSHLQHFPSIARAPSRPTTPFAPIPAFARNDSAGLCVNLNDGVGLTIKQICWLPFWCLAPSEKRQRNHDAPSWHGRALAKVFLHLASLTSLTSLCS